jgi:hypothetical protein
VKAKATQQKIIHQLSSSFDPEHVKSEWNIRKDSTDAFADRMIYAPRPDIAVGPFNLSREAANLDSAAIYEAARGDMGRALIEAVEHQNEGVFNPNSNPRCLLAIEIEFNGSSKHVLGSITNASMLGFIGVVIASPAYANKVMRIGAYARALRQVQKAPEGLFTNVAYFEASEFIAFAGRFARRREHALRL